MDKQAFKQRMQNLKSYRENNPGKGYWDWRNSLPDNLKYTDDTEYNMRGAYESGAQPILENDGFYHLPTRNPQTGEILKTSLHPTFWKGLAEDAKIGYNTYFVGDKVYTKSKEEGPINVYTDGGEVARKSLKDIRKESIIEDKLDYDVMLQNQNAYQTVQRLMDDPSYMRRAQQVKEKYGDDYTQIYADLIDAYNNSPELLPKAKRTAFEDNARARMATTTESTKRHMDGGEFPKMGEYEYQYDINGVPYGTTIHEMNHNADYLKNKAIDADANSNLYYWMRSALKPFSRIDPNTDKLTKYYSKPTEQKAYMNQLREFMYANKMIDTRDQIVTPDLIKQAISKLPKGMQSIKKASEQFKSMRSYTKWFNTIPLLGVGAVGANKYFTSNENRD